MSGDPGAFERVREVRADVAFPLFLHPQWHERMPWLFQGTTARGDAGTPFDLGLATPERMRGAIPSYSRIAAEAGCRHIALSRQVHGCRVVAHRLPRPGVRIGEAADGHVTASPDLLLAVTVADCVPVFAVDPARRRIALVHAGWRGAAAGILEAALRLLGRVGELRLHFGPAICGSCYEVGPEVHSALGLPQPADPRPIDLRTHLAVRAEGVGVRRQHITISAWCTRCDGSPFFSHRAGHAQRQAGVLAIRPPHA